MVGATPPYIPKFEFVTICMCTQRPCKCFRFLIADRDVVYRPLSTGVLPLHVWLDLLYVPTGSENLVRIWDVVPESQDWELHM